MKTNRKLVEFVFQVLKHIWAVRCNNSASQASAEGESKHRCLFPEAELCGKGRGSSSFQANMWNLASVFAYHKKEDDKNSWKVFQPLENQGCIDMVFKESKLIRAWCNSKCHCFLFLR